MCGNVARVRARAMVEFIVIDALMIGRPIDFELDSTYFNVNTQVLLLFF